MEGVNTINVKIFNSSVNGDLQGVVDALAQGGRVAVRNDQGMAPLLVAAKYGHTDVCGILLASGSQVNEQQLKSNNTALHIAALRGHEVVVEVLLSWGAIVDPQDHAGMTPLYFACQEDHLACVFALLKAGASVSVRNDSGVLPIHVAAQENRVDVVRTLVDYGP